MKSYTIKLKMADLFQVLDGLRSRAESWESTAAYLKTGEMGDDLILIEECSDAEEAAEIAGHYQSIIESIEMQMSEQGR